MMTLSSQDEGARPSKLWKQLSPDDRLTAARAFWSDSDSHDRQVEAIGLIAKQIKFRPKSVQTLPSDKKARYLLTLIDTPDTVALRLLVLHHLSSRRPMLERFLNSLGIAHDAGIITEEDLKPPEPSKLTTAVADLTANHPAADVQLYFATLLAQDPDTWGELRKYESDQTEH